MICVDNDTNHRTVYIIQVSPLPSTEHAYTIVSKISIRIQIGQRPTYWISFIHKKIISQRKTDSMQGFSLTKRCSHFHSISCIISMLSPVMLMTNYLRTSEGRGSHYSIKSLNILVFVHIQGPNAFEQCISLLNRILD